MRLKSIYSLFDTSGSQKNGKGKRKRVGINDEADTLSLLQEGIESNMMNEGETAPAETVQNGHEVVVNVVDGIDSRVDELTIMVRQGQEEVRSQIKGLEAMIVELTSVVCKGQDEFGAQVTAVTVSMDVVKEKVSSMVDVVVTNLSTMVTCLEGIERKLYLILKRTLGLP